MNRLSISLIAMATSWALWSGCGPKTETPGDTESAALEALVQKAVRLSEDAVPLKNQGDNAGALAKFDQAQTLLEKAGPRSRAALASNWDDIASIQARLGNFAGARQLYLRAQNELQALGSGPGQRLYDGISYRLKILDTLEKTQHVCQEPPKFDPASSALPYFPNMEQLQELIGRLFNPLLQGCLDSDKTQVRTRMLLTGDGRLLLAEVQGELSGTPAAACIERRILEAAPNHQDKLPKFFACFRSMATPFIVARESAWEDRSQTEL
jgi:tetratricopeptide (TPR) repeat protein